MAAVSWSPPVSLHASPSPLSDYPSSHSSSKLPIEIWREIFSYATLIPRGYDSSLVSPFDLSDISDGHHAFLKHLARNHQTKQALCLVSRKWRKIAQELIFEYLFLQDGFNWGMLADGLEASQSADEARGGRGAGWYVKRLEICMHAWTDALAAAAARVIRCCPNLHVLTVGLLGGPGAGTPAMVVNAVFEACPRTLRSVKWSSDLGPQLDLMITKLPLAAGLETLLMCVQAPYTPSAAILAAPVALPRLHTLELAATDEDYGGILRVIAHWQLPRLQRVILTHTLGTEELLAFFRAHGARIATLEFDFLGAAAGEVFSRCPLLAELVLHVHWAPLHVLAHPGVRRIGLRGLHFLDYTYGALCEVLDSLRLCFSAFLCQGRFPALQLVRLLDFEQTRFRVRKWRPADVVLWAFWVKRFERLGVRLEDHEGNLIKIVFSEMNVLLQEDGPRWWRQQV